MSPAQSFTEIPRLDLSLAQTDSKNELLSQLRQALTDVGFLYIYGHGVPAEVIDRMVKALPRLFALPAETKHSIALEESPHFLGYSSAGSETTAGKVDLREQVEFATELIATWDEGEPLYERLRGPNQVSLLEPDYTQGFP
jgi:isopenicillin N synthase-like dioxygenase